MVITKRGYLKREGERERDPTLKKQQRKGLEKDLQLINKNNKSPTTEK